VSSASLSVYACAAAGCAARTSAAIASARASMTSFHVSLGPQRYSPICAYAQCRRRSNVSMLRPSVRILTGRRVRQAKLTGAKLMGGNPGDQNTTASKDQCVDPRARALAGECGARIFCVPRSACVGDGALTTITLICCGSRFWRRSRGGFMVTVILMRVSETPRRIGQHAHSKLRALLWVRPI
jgi:hypothetical protein